MDAEGYLGGAPDGAQSKCSVVNDSTQVPWRFWLAGRAADLAAFAHLWWNRGVGFGRRFFCPRMLANRREFFSRVFRDAKAAHGQICVNLRDLREKKSRRHIRTARSRRTMKSDGRLNEAMAWQAVKKIAADVRRL